MSDDIVTEVLKSRYFREGETSWEDICKRVATYIGNSCEEKKTYYEIIRNKDFVPNSPTLMNAGTKTPLLSACYAYGIEDEIESILQTFYNAILVMKYGGGCGIDYSSLRPKGDVIKTTGGTSSGVVSFMEMFDQGIETVREGGRRRGAAIASLDISHPDIEEFIASKLEEGRLSNMNISVRVTDAFMEAVKNDADWNLEFNGKIYKTIKARDLFKKVVHGAWRYGEPGILFIDEIKRKEPYVGDEFKIGQNPCVTGDTLILTFTGYKRIDERVDKGTTIWNGYDWSFVVPRVTGINQKVITVEFSNGSVLKCTPYHGFLIHEGNSIIKKEAKDLVVGDKLVERKYLEMEDVLDTQKPIKVVSIKDEGEIADKVYCFNEPKNHTGIFNGVITSQCGETNLLTCKNGGESCNLGSINLSNFYNEQTGTIELDKIADATRVATRFLNEIIDKNFYPVKEIEYMTKNFRRIGLGVMGWHDLLIKCGVPYGSEESMLIAEKIMQTINAVSIDESEKMAKEHGKSFFWIHKCNIEIPRYNIATTVIAPTGTISLLAGCSSGIEPIFSLVYKRYTWVDGTKEGYMQVHPLFEKKLNEYLEQNYEPTARKDKYNEVIEHAYSTGSIQDIEWLPEDFRKLFRTSLDITPKEHIDMQAAFQKYTANNISKTINMPKETTEDEIWNIYFYGWEKKLKGMTVYRSGSRDTEVLELKKKEPVTTPVVIPLPTNGRILPKRPRDLPATNSKRRSGCGKLIISVAEYNGRPYETIIKNKGGCDAMNDAIGQLISLAMRWNVPTWDIIKTLKNVTCPVAYKKFSKGEADGKSCADIVGRVIEELVPDDINENKQYNFEATTDNYIMDKDKEDNREVCPDCGEPLNMIEGCRSCACGYSKCG